jgi:hypothetical protein
VNHCKICNDNTYLDEAYNNISNDSVLYWQIFDLSYYRENYESNTTIRDILNTEDGLYLKLCNDRNIYSYNCDDGYYNFLLPFRCDAMPIMAFLLFSFMAVMITLGIVLPRIVKMYKLITKPRSEFYISDEKAVRTNCVKDPMILRTIVLLFFDVRTYSVLFLLITCLMGVISNLILTFRQVYPIYRTYPFSNPAGVVRVLMFLSTVACYVSQITQWLHINKNIERVTTRVMSKRLYILMFTVHIINVSAFLLSVIVSAAMNSTTIIFLALSIIYTIWGIVFIVLFMISGCVLYDNIINNLAELSSTSSESSDNDKESSNKVIRNITSFTRYKFTKFLIVITCMITILVMTSLLSIPMFAVSSDIYSMVIQLLQTPWYEFIGLVTVIILSVNTINRDEIASMYKCRPTKN